MFNIFKFAAFTKIILGDSAMKVHVQVILAIGLQNVTPVPLHCQFFTQPFNGDKKWSFQQTLHKHGAL